ncbi:vesicular glutamate transporter 1-like isoform X3 [Mercenaria mercenaria]|nr:vesicular glutamate transporter 1-like isoform X3 [Mercenaria mercenaria]
MMSQIPGGWLSERFGGKHVIGTCIGITSTLTLLIPAMARTSAYMVVVARVLMGLSTGASTPGWYMLTGVWALPHERSRFSGAIWFGSVFGIVLGYSSAGFLCAHGFDNGWASVFYVHGLIGYLFVACWLYIVYSSPKQHPRISEAERKLLEGNIHIPIEKQAVKSKVPWKKILTYGPVWVIFITHASDNWIYYLCITCLPLYMKEVLKFDIQSNGIYSSLPFLTMMVAITLAATLADLIRSKQFLKVTTIRKLFQVTGLLGVAAFVLIPGYLDCSLREIVIVCLCLCTFFESVGCVGGHTCVAVDISPRYASIIFGISNAIASIPGILAPLMVAELTKNQTSAEWRIVFYIAAAVSVFAAVIFGVFASSELAPWEERKKTDVQIPLKESNG